ncbi:hypothetical protein HDU97_007388 [Phlyctochytrium planicorne]|nr:hypothetical protein HDU97_007388 [Phlyctochytrium planicorne]
MLKRVLRSKPAQCPSHQSSHQRFLSDLRRCYEEAERLLGDIQVKLENGRTVWAHRAIIANQESSAWSEEAVIMAYEAFSSNLATSTFTDFTLYPSSATPTSLTDPFPTFKFLLAARVPYFEALFTSTFIDSTITHTITQLDTEILELVHTYIHQGILPSLTFRKAAACLRAADYYQCDGFKDECIRQLYALAHETRCDCKECLNGGLQRVAVFAQKHGLDGLLEDAIWVMVKRWEEVLGSRASLELSPTILESLESSILSSITPSTMTDFLNAHHVEETAPASSLLSEMIQKCHEACRSICSDQLDQIWSNDKLFFYYIRYGAPNIAGLSTDRRIIDMAVQGLNERNVFNVMVALERIIGPGDEDERPNIKILRAARADCIRFIAKRWMNMAYSGLFDDKPDCILKEIGTAAGVTHSDIVGTFKAFPARPITVSKAPPKSRPTSTHSTARKSTSTTSLSSASKSKSVSRDAFKKPASSSRKVTGATSKKSAASSRSEVATSSSTSSTSNIASSSSNARSNNSNFSTSSSGPSASPSTQRLSKIPVSSKSRTCQGSA